MVVETIYNLIHFAPLTRVSLPRISSSLFVLPVRRPSHTLLQPVRAYRRRLSTTIAKMNSNSSAPAPKFSENEDPSVLTDTLRPLIAPSGHWQLTQDGKGIERLFRFRTFKAAWAFMNDTASACKTARHHPEWSNVYSTVFVRWTTHRPPGLSSKDIEMAKQCDELALRDESKALEEAPPLGTQTDTLKGVVDKVTAAGDCCGKPSSGDTRQDSKV